MLAPRRAHPRDAVLPPTLGRSPDRSHAIAQGLPGGSDRQGLPEGRSANEAPVGLGCYGRRPV